MKYTVTHTTTYRYSSPVSVCHNVVMLEPRQSSALSCEHFDLQIRPSPSVSVRREDMFGNLVQRFSLEESHSTLEIKAISNVTTRYGELPGTSPTCGEVINASRSAENPDRLKIAPFFFDSPRIRRSKTYASYSDGSYRDDQSIIEFATNLTRQIHSDFRYDKDATAVNTPTEEAFRGRHGVCQDFAHVAVACLRSRNLPTRYVSGYLRTTPPPGTQRLIGNDESHAWFSVYCGRELGWIDFDPTNNCICGSNHVPIAFGRDYTDVVPVRGIFLGGGEPAMSVSVDVS